MSFSKTLSKLMADRHITNYRLAKDIGVHQSTVKNWLDGKTPTLEYAVKVAEYFEVDVGEVIKEASAWDVR